MIRAAKKLARWCTRLFFGLFLCKTANCIILPIVFLFHRKYVPLQRIKKPGKNRLAVIMPRIPDVTHHFLYREQERLKRLFNFKLVAIQRGQAIYSTPVTDYLMEGFSCMPDTESGRYYTLYYLHYLKYLIRHPVKVANLIRLYEKELGGKWHRFIDHRSILYPCHPLHGFYLASLLSNEGIAHIHAYCSNVSTNYMLVAAHMLDLSFSFTGYADFDFGYIYKMLAEKLELSDFAVVHTNFCKERLLGYTSEKYRDKIHVIRFGLDLGEFTPRGSSGSKNLRLLSIGGLAPKKGYRYLIKACEILRDKGINFELLIIGSGPLSNSLKELTSFLKLEEYITFLGAIPNEELMKFYTTDAILVQPSVYAVDGERDGVPTVISEAMAMGMAVISTYVSGIPEAVKNRQNGLLVLPEDHRALADAIMELHSDEALWKLIVENGRKTAMELFDSSHWIPKIKKLLRASLAG